MNKEIIQKLKEASAKAQGRWKSIDSEKQFEGLTHRKDVFSGDGYSVADHFIAQGICAQYADFIALARNHINELIESVDELEDKLYHATRTDKEEIYLLTAENEALKKRVEELEASSLICPVCGAECYTKDIAESSKHVRLDFKKLTAENETLKMRVSELENIDDGYRRPRQPPCRGGSDSVETRRLKSTLVDKEKELHAWKWSCNEVRRIAELWAKDIKQLTTENDHLARQLADKLSGVCDDSLAKHLRWEVNLLTAKNTKMRECLEYYARQRGEYDEPSPAIECLADIEGNKRKKKEVKE